MRSSSVTVGVIILLIAGGLFTADYVFVESPRMQGGTQNQEGEETTVSSSSSSSSSSIPNTAGSSSSTVTEATSSASSTTSRSFVKKGVSTKKKAAINVESVLEKLQLIQKETDESGFMALIPGIGNVKRGVLLRNNDRAFFFAWAESDDAKTIFNSLKQALSEQFSGKMTGLIDETRTPANGPPVDFLSFEDQTLSPERVIFLRIRTRLYEIHVAKNGEDVVDAFIAALSI